MKKNIISSIALMMNKKNVNIRFNMVKKINRMMGIIKVLKIRVRVAATKKKKMMKMFQIPND